MTDKDKKAFATSFDRLPNKEAEKAFDSKTLLTSAEFASFKAYQHALAFTVAGLADKDMLAEVHKAVKSAIDNGTSFNDFKKTLKPFLISKGWLSPELTGDDKADKALLKDYERVLNRRLKTIYHTNKQTAYAAGKWERIQKTKDFLPYLQYLPSASVNKRDGHKAYYGIVRPVDDPIWQSIFPPNGFGCKCSVKQITKSKARELGITDDERIAKLPTPEFDSNFDRLGSLLRLAEDKHGVEFAEKLGIDLTNKMLELSVKMGSVSVADFTHITVTQSEVERLLFDPANGDEILSEAMAGAEYQAYYKVRLERPTPEFDANGKPKAGFDYWITDTGQKLDFLFTMYGEKPIRIEKYNQFFAHTDDAWKGKIATIQHHFEKADIVPMDLRYITDVKNRVKLISYVLSLPKEQQKQVVFIWGEPK